uniref:Tissue factor pathway inhibitor n=1 Tax=Rhipicephalus appendiculatus TaxID=34631 RepID=A0A131Z067_RHIAP
MNFRAATIAVFFTVTFTIAAAQWRPRCYRKPSAGYCYGRLLRWFYDHKARQCRMFTYSGCFGNFNRFSSEQECLQVCSARQRSHPVCGMGPEVGMCNSSVPMWYFDAGMGVCRGFLYSGCGGNSNKFSSCQECMSRCSGDYHARGICKFLTRRFAKQFYKREPTKSRESRRPSESEGNINYPILNAQELREEVGEGYPSPSRPSLPPRLEDSVENSRNRRGWTKGGG